MLSSQSRSCDRFLDVHGLTACGEGLFHQSADLELDRPLGWYLHRVEGLGVLGHAGAALLHLEDAEVAEFKAVALSQFGDDAIEKGLNDFLDGDPFLIRSLGNLINQFLFRDRGHVLTPLTGWVPALEGQSETML